MATEVYGKRDQAEIDARWQACQPLIQASFAWQGTGVPGAVGGSLDVGTALPADPVKLQARNNGTSGIQPIEMNFFFRWPVLDNSEPRPAILYLHGLAACQNLGGLPILSYDTWWLKLCPPDLVVIIPHLPDGRRLPWVASSVKATLLYGVEYAIARGVDPTRVYVAGWSMGAFAAWDLAMDSAEGKAPFAAAVPVSGYPLDMDRVSVLANFPLWSFHGANDEQNPVDQDDQAIAKLAALMESSQGAQSTLRYTRYDWSPSTTEADGRKIQGHAAHELVFADPELGQWLCQQSRNDQLCRDAKLRERTPSPPKRYNLPGRRSQAEVDRRWIRQRFRILDCFAEQHKYVVSGSQELTVSGLPPMRPRLFQAPPGFRGCKTSPERLDFYVHMPPLPDGSEMFDTGRPALLFLHGASGSKDEMGLVSLAYHCWWLYYCPQELVVIIPHCPSRKKHWLQPSLKATLFHALDQLIAECDVDSNRIYVSGYSMGGTASWDFAAESATGKMKFAAAVPVTPTITSPDKANELVNFPLWIFNAKIEWEQIQALTLDAVERLMEAGANSGANTTLRHTNYDWAPSTHDKSGYGAGHGAHELAYGEPEMWKWLLEQTRE